MNGSKGTPRRRRLIRVEFAAGAVGCTALGALTVLTGQGWSYVLGAWLICIGVNYVPLALAAHALSRPGALEAELEGVEIPSEARRAGIRQFWILVPFALVIAAVAEWSRP